MKGKTEVPLFACIVFVLGVGHIGVLCFQNPVHTHSRKGVDACLCVGLTTPSQPTQNTPGGGSRVRHSRVVMVAGLTRVSVPVGVVGSFHT